MFSFFGSNNSNSNNVDCPEIMRLSKEINSNIDTIEGFVKDKGFIAELKSKLTEIQSQANNFKKKCKIVEMVKDNLQSINPDCQKALRDLKELQQLSSEKDARIANLLQSVRDLQKAQNSNAPQSVITKKQNDCKQICTDILTNINDKLKGIVPAFIRSQQDINLLLDNISAALLTPNGPAAPDAISGVNPMNTPDVMPRAATTSDTDDTDINNAINNLEPKSPTTGGYYYPTSSSSKRNKKSIGRRKKHKRNNKTRR